jgi:hypothetical protein
VRVAEANRKKLLVDPARRENTQIDEGNSNGGYRMCYKPRTSTYIKAALVDTEIRVCAERCNNRGSIPGRGK